MKKIQSLNRHFFTFLIVGLIILVIVRCNDDSEENMVMNDDPVSVEEQFIIDPSGGTYILPSGIKVEIPEGAVTQSVEISIEELLAANATSLAPINFGEKTSFISGITVSTEDFDFKKPVSIKIPVQELDENGLIVLYELDQENNSWGFSNETIVVSNQDRFIEIILDSSTGEGSRIGREFTDTEDKSLILKQIEDALPNEDPCRQKTYKAIAESIDNATSGGCNATRLNEQYIFSDCNPTVTEKLLIQEISSSCEPEVSIEFSGENKLKVGEIETVSITTTIGGLALSDQVVHSTTNAFISSEPESISTDEGGITTFNITGVETGMGSIDFTITLDYYLTTISASGGGEYELHEYNRVTKTVNASFSILVYDVPLVTTSFDRNAEKTTAIVGGEVTEDWDDEVTERGVYLNDKKIVLGKGLGLFSADIDDLTPNVTYELKAFAFNEAGDGYGDVIRFVLDIDGNIYPIVNIGEQDWISENLTTSRLNNGTEIPFLEDKYDWEDAYYDQVPAYVYYDNDQSNKYVYGALYNWFTVDTHQLCPIGWHVPSKEEFEILIDFIGGVENGGKLKEAGTEHWKAPNTEATNEFGLTALPGGGRFHQDLVNGQYDFGFGVIGQKGLWWTTSYGSTYGYASYVELSFNKGLAERSGYWGGTGMSVRCVQDSPE